MELWPGMYKDLGFIPQTNNKTDKCQLLCSSCCLYTKIKRGKNQSPYNTELSLLGFCSSHWGFAPGKETSRLCWPPQPLFLWCRKEGSRVILAMGSLCRESSYPPSLESLWCLPYWNHYTVVLREERRSLQGLSANDTGITIKTPWALVLAHGG